MASFEDMGHQGMIGAMYEGLARKVTAESIFRGLDLRVVEGKIKNGVGTYSRQIDCMIVVGDGEKIPNVEQYIYPPDRVVAVLEIKKTLNKAELADAMNLLENVAALDGPR